MKSSCKIKQRDLTDCGVASLASIAAHYGLHMPLARIRQYAGTDRQGTNVAGLIEAAGKLSLMAKGIKAQMSNLKDLPLPLIAHVIRDEHQHFVVLYKVSGKQVKYMDPADGHCHSQLLGEFRKQWTGILVLAMPDDAFQKADQRVSVVQHFWQLLKPHHFIVVQTIIAAIAYTILGLAPSFYIQKIVDHVLPGQNAQLLNLLTVIMFGSLLMQIILGYVKSLFALETGLAIDRKLIFGYYKHLLKLPQSFFDSMQVGEIISRVNDAVKIRAFINNTAVEMLINILVISFSMMLMFAYNYKLALMVLFAFPCYAFIYLVNNLVNRKWQKKLMEKAALLESQLVESIGSMRTIKRLAIEEFVKQKTETRFFNLLGTIYTSSRYNLQTATSADFLLKFTSICMLWTGSYFVIRRALTAGELLSFYSLLGYFTGPATSLLSANRSLQEALIAGNRLFEITSLDTEQAMPAAIHISKHLIGDIEFDDIYFRYGSRGSIFNGLSTTIVKGQSTAIVGESGSGKSTLLSLLQNIYPLQKGRIRIGEIDLKYASNESLRKCIGVVPQEIQLISGTIMENIAVAEYEPDLKKILQLSKLLGIDEFIEKLPDGYHTILGEQGMNLSGGERQRIAIARAFYRDPEILILDEATSSLDAITESKLQGALAWFLEQGKTLIVIAHRLASIKHYDRIKVLKDGKLAEEGSHKELMNLGGHYKKMWDKLQEDIYGTA